MRIILFLSNAEAAELLEASSEESYVSQNTYDKVRSAIETVTTEEEFKKIAAFEKGTNEIGCAHIFIPRDMGSGNSIGVCQTCGYIA